MGQDVIIALLFVTALVYLGYLIFRNFRTSGCPSGCGSCAIDLTKIQKELQKKGLN